LEARLRNLARDLGLPEGRVRRMIGVVVVGQMLDGMRAGLIKGATNLELRLGTARTRVSSDLDLVRRSDLAEFRARLTLALREGWAGFSGRLIDEGEIPAPMPDGYRPHRFRLKLEFYGHSFCTVLVEVAAAELLRADERGEIIHPSEPESWFETLGLPLPRPIAVLPLSHQLAQKIHACTAPNDEHWVNDRAHDLVDLQLGFELFEGSLAELQRVARRLFAARKRHSWPPTATLRSRWADLYNEAAASLSVRASAEEAVAWLNQQIARIDGAGKSS
jgi:hypothetical protein